MLADIFSKSLWPGLAVCTILYISDYYLTVACARLYQARGRQKITFEGSFELTPYFQTDIDSQKLFSRRFWTVLVLRAALLAVVWLLTREIMTQLYDFALGSMVLIELAIHVRHFRNLFLFPAIDTDAVRGHIEYARSLTLRMSAVELYAFAGLFGLLCLMLHSWFIVGGVFACVSTAAKHQKAARECIVSPQSADSTTSGT